MTIKTKRLKVERKHKSPKDGFTDNEILGLATYILGKRWTRDKSALADPKSGAEYLKVWLQAEPGEVFAVIYLDGKHRIIASEIAFRGTIDGASVHPRGVRRALAHNAAAVIVAHNHPSGVAEPSSADIAITRRLIDALTLIDVHLLDHFVVGENEPISMAARGLI